MWCSPNCVMLTRTMSILICSFAHQTPFSTYIEGFTNPTCQILHIIAVATTLTGSFATAKVQLLSP